MTYVLSNVEWRFRILPANVFAINNTATPPAGYTNQLVGHCDGCGIATATDDGFGNITLANGSKPIYGDAGGNGLFSVCNSTTIGLCPITSSGGNNTGFSFGGNGTTTLTGAWAAAGVNALLWNQAYCIDTLATSCGTTGSLAQFGGTGAPGGTINWSNGIRANGAVAQVVQTGVVGVVPGPNPWNAGNGGTGNVMCCALNVWEDASGLHIQRQVALVTPVFNKNYQSYQLNYSVVPVPAAVWLFGSALGLMGAIRRKHTA